MYDRFTGRARKVMQLANQEACRYNHEYIGSEHILLGLATVGMGAAAHVLKSLDVDPGRIRAEVERMITPGPGHAQGFLERLLHVFGRTFNQSQMSETPRAKKVIEYVDEARILPSNYVGTEHLLLGLLRETEGVAAQVLMNLGLSLETIRCAVLGFLGRPQPDAGVTRLPEHIVRIVRSHDELIEQIQQAMEQEITANNFDKATRLREQVGQLRDIRARIVDLWID